MKLLLNLTNVHRDEQEIVKEYLEADSWQTDNISIDEQNALISMINYIIDKRVNACNLSYLELINLKIKLGR
jgi:hypothetical protein